MTDTRPASSKTVTNGTIDTPAVCPRCGNPTSFAVRIGNRQYCYPIYCNCEPVDFGWRCPGCQRVYAPGVEECRHCNDKSVLSDLSRGDLSFGSADSG